MGQWQQWLRMLVGLVIVIAIFDMLLPENELKKLAKLVMGLVIMLAVLQPILGLIYSGWDDSLLTLTDPQVSLNYDWSKQSDRVHEAGMQPVLKLVTDNTSHQLEALLISNNLVENAEVSLSLFNDGKISEVKVELKLEETQADSASIDELVGLVKNQVGRYFQIPSSDIEVSVN